MRSRFAHIRLNLQSKRFTLAFNQLGVLLFSAIGSATERKQHSNNAERLVSCMTPGQVLVSALKTLCQYQRIQHQHPRAFAKITGYQYQYPRRFAKTKGYRY
jgi:hypothetical protein